jgi:putative phosphoserine phosphatase/1-acylglycerol-3-phosphate O-acyltransferase
LAGTVFIDRENAASAIEAMQPLVDAMRNERKSVVIAPEGTRTVSPKLAPFKKGAFHLAIQAGVPVVPIVIHNAGDVAPKGDFVFRPATVEVDVLPPVDTSDWAAETIEEHVAEIRRMFQVKLGQEQKQAESPLVAEPQAPAPAAPPAAKPAVKKASRKKKPAKKAARKKAPARKKPARTEPAATPESRPPDRQVQAPGKKVLKKKALKKRAPRKKVKVAPKKAAARKAPRKKPLRKKVLGKKPLTGDTGA